MTVSPKALTTFDDYREMLGDTARMDAFTAAIRAAVQPGDTVVDVGAGTGILSFIALQAGARHVYLIEKSDAIDLARAVVLHNGWEDRVTFMQAMSTEVTLPQPADVLISETLGSFGIDENTLPYTIDARQRLLTPGGRMVPEGLELWIAPAETPQIWDEKVAFWQNVGGVDFSPAAAIAARRLSLAHIEPAQLIGKAVQLSFIDLRLMEADELQVKFRSVFGRQGRVHALVGWFKAYLGHGITLSTAPGEPPTHWRQAWLPLSAPVDVAHGEYVDVVLHLQAHPDKNANADGSLIHYNWEFAQAQVGIGVRWNLGCPCGSGAKLSVCCG